MLVLKEGETCPFASKCPYVSKNLNLICQGTNKDRKGEFVCMYVDEGGKFFKDGEYRTNLDVTGRMEIIHD